MDTSPQPWSSVMMRSTFGAGFVMGADLWIWSSAFVDIPDKIISTQRLESISEWNLKLSI